MYSLNIFVKFNNISTYYWTLTCMLSVLKEIQRNVGDAFLLQKPWRLFEHVFDQAMSNGRHS